MLRRFNTFQLAWTSALTASAMATTMKIASSTEIKGARTMAPQRASIGAVAGRIVRVQHRQVSQASFAPVARAQQLQRNTHVVRVAAQEAPVAQSTGTEVRTYNVLV